MSDARTSAQEPHQRSSGERTAVAVVGTDLDGVVTFWSAGAKQLYGVPAAEAVGRDINDLGDWGLDQADIATSLLASRCGIWVKDHPVVTLAGRTFWVRTIASTGRGPTDQDEVVASSMPCPAGPGPRRSPLSRLRTIADAGATPSVIVRQGLLVSYVSPELQALLGYLPREVIGTEVLSYVHPYDRDRLTAEAQRSLRSASRNGSTAIRVRHASGHWVPVQARVINLLADPDVRGIVVMIVDLSGYQNKTDSLSDRRALFHEVAQLVREGVCVIDGAGQTVFANQAMSQLIGRDLAQLYSLNLRDLLGFERQAGTAPVDVRRGDGTTVRLQIRPSPWRDNHGVEVGTIVICSDAREHAPSDESGGYSEQPTGWELLSRREVEVIEAIATGDRVPLIASRLFVSQSTIRNQLSSAFRKLKVANQQELVELLHRREAGQPEA